MKKILLVLLIFFSANILQAQKEDTTYKYWMSLGLWVDRDISFNFNYNFSLGDNFYKVNYLTRGGSFISKGVNPGSDGIVFSSIEVSIGKRLQTKWLQASLFVGPSFVFGEKRINANLNEKFKTAGLEIDTQLLFRLANEVGVGIGLFANLNFVKGFSGINVNLTLGNGK